MLEQMRQSIPREGRLLSPEITNKAADMANI